MSLAQWFQVCAGGGAAVLVVDGVVEVGRASRSATAGGDADAVTHLGVPAEPDPGSARPWMVVEAEGAVQGAGVLVVQVLDDPRPFVGQVGAANQLGEQADRNVNLHDTTETRRVAAAVPWAATVPGPDAGPG